MIPQIFPSPQKFKGQSPGETVITSIRYHPIIMTRTVILTTLLLLAGVAGLVWLPFSWWSWFFVVFYWGWPGWLSASVVALVVVELLCHRPATDYD